jgi:hypothetical protein
VHARSVFSNRQKQAEKTGTSEILQIAEMADFFFKQQFC